MAAGKDGKRVLSEVGTMWYNLRGDSQATAIWHTFIGMPNLTGKQVGLPEVGDAGGAWLMFAARRRAHHVAGPITGREFSASGFSTTNQGRCGVTPSPISRRLRMTSLCVSFMKYLLTCLLASALLVSRHDVCSPEQTDFLRHDHR